MTPLEAVEKFGVDHCSCGVLRAADVTPLPEKCRKKQGRASKTDRDARRLAKFHALWDELHAHEWTGDAEKAAAYIATVITRLPCGECRRDAREYVKVNPPPTDPAKGSAWAVRWHNAINLKLGKQKWVPS